jgi:hypothetical protein
VGLTSRPSGVVTLTVVRAGCQRSDIGWKAVFIQASSLHDSLVDTPLTVSAQSTSLAASTRKGFAMWSRTAGRRWDRMLSAPSLSLTALALFAVLSLPALAEASWRRSALVLKVTRLSAPSLLTPAAAFSADAPLPASRAKAPLPVPAPLVSMRPPSVFGRAIVGHILTGFAGVWSSGLPLELGYQWRRCPVAGPCTDIPGATSPVYFLGPGDVGLRIQLRVSASSGGATEVRDSEPTEAVSDEREPGAAGSSGTSETPSPPASAPASEADRERMIDPFPVVRIRGRFTLHWTRFTLVTVRAPVGAVIAMKCTGRGCPFRNRVRTVSGHTLVRISGLERRFSPGVRLVLRITEPGRVGKYTRISIRRGRRPARWDGCVMPGSAESVACPAA